MIMSIKNQPSYTAYQVVSSRNPTEYPGRIIYVNKTRQIVAGQLDPFDSNTYWESSPGLPFNLTDWSIRDQFGSEADLKPVGYYINKVATQPKPTSGGTALLIMVSIIGAYYLLFTPTSELFGGGSRTIKLELKR
jgi:hypothetical protein